MRALSDNNLTKDLVVHKGSDVSIGTQLEEERMQGDQIIETSDYSKLKYKGIMISKSRDQKQTL